MMIPYIVNSVFCKIIHRLYDLRILFNSCIEGDARILLSIILCFSIDSGGTKLA
eukprot:UN02973